MKSTRWLPAGLLVGGLMLAALMVHAQGAQLLVSNVQVAQQPFSTLVDVTYDLETVGDIAVTVRLFLSTDAGATYPCLCHAVAGDIGAGVLPGASRHIVWDAGVDFPGFSSTTCQLQVIADDAPNLADFVYVGSGTFIMGSPEDEPGHGFGNDELQHQVILTHGIYVQTTEATNQQYMEMAQWAYDQGYATATSASLSDNLDGSTQELLDLDAGYCEIAFSGGVFTCVNPDQPVKSVTWYGSATYCDWLSLQQGLPRAYDHGTWQCGGGDPYGAVGYRLPTEAEWEYSCRSGSATAFANGPITEPNCTQGEDPNLSLIGWYCMNSGGVTHPVAMKSPNAYGLYDMHGNVIEWCNDWYEEYGGDVVNPTGPGTGEERVLRGGCSKYGGGLCRSGSRLSMHPARADTMLGYRSVRSVN